MKTLSIACLGLLTLSAACFSPPEALTTDGEAGGSDDAGLPGASETGGAETGGADAGGTGPNGGDDIIDLQDEFDADQGWWSFADDPGAEQEGPGQWEYRAGDLVQTSDISGPDGDVPSRGTFALGGDPDWDAYSVEVAFTADDDGVAGVLCHASPAGDYVRFDLDHETGIVRLVRRQGSAFTVLAESEAFTPPVELGVMRVLELHCGATYIGMVDGVQVLQAEGSAETEGSVGLYASSIGDGPDGLRFHWIEVE